MRYYLPDIPKIKLKYAHEDNGKIVLFLLAYLSPLMLAFFRVEKDMYIYIECVYYPFVMCLAEQIIFKERKRNFRCFKKRTKRYVKLILLSIVHCIGILIVLTSISAIISDGKSENQASIERINLAAQLVLVLIYAPVVEEVIFRYVLRRIIKGERLYIAVSGATFGVAHVLSSVGTNAAMDVIAYVLPYLGIGFYLAYLYVSTNSIETCIITHRAVNLFVAMPAILLMNR